MRKIIALFIAATLCAPGPVFAGSLESSFHTDNPSQVIGVTQSPLNIESVAAIPSESLSPADFGNREILSKLPIQPMLSAKSLNQRKILELKSGISAPKEKASPVQKIKGRISKTIQYTKASLKVNRQNLATNLSQFFDRSARFPNHKDATSIAPYKKETQSLKPWQKAGALAAATAPLTKVQSAIASPLANPQNAPVHHSILASLFGASGLTHLVLTAVAVAFTYWVWKKFGSNLRQKISDWKNARSKSWKETAKNQKEENPLASTITFADIAGQDKAVNEVRKIISAFESPSKYKSINPRFKPRNAFLLVGPPGTGKTLLAEAVAGELKLDKGSFFKTDGSSFMNKFVGVGPDAVRKFFEKAREESKKSKKPSLIFIDEIDGFGNRGGTSDSGADHEKQMTIGALLTEMNNLSGPDYNVLVIGATNEFGKLDKALKRSGRFGTHIALENPDLQGRESILRLHTKDARLSPDVDLHKIAEKITGFSGADIEAVAQRATEIAVEDNQADFISQADFEKAVEHIKENINQKAKAVDSSNNSSSISIQFEDPETMTTGFSQVAGQDEAKAEVAELVDQVKNRARYLEINPQFRPLRGALLFGPPGTGKTLMARAIAKESGALFFKVDGTDFLKKFVGEGPQAVRDIFEAASYESKREKKPAIIFIDEIDAIGRARGSDLNGSQDALVNQLLTAIDGFKTENNVTVIGATNKPESLDPALTRGGRIELQIPIGLPDVVGREGILKVHTQGIALDSDVNLRKVAQQTAGFSGADMESLVMKATSASIKRGANALSQADFISSIDRVQLGMERKLAMPEDEKQVVAYHETGHALVSHLLPDADPIHKVTIVPHGLNALGLMQAASDVERNIQSRSYLVARMAVALGGRAGEELMSERLNGKKENFSGASNDLEQATKIARHMVMKFGMSEKVGLVSYGFENDRQNPRPASEEMNRLIEAEVKALVQDSYVLARQTLQSNWEIFKTIAEELKKKETLRGEDFDRLIPKAKNSQK